MGFEFLGRFILILDVERHGLPRRHMNFGGREAMILDRHVDRRLGPRHRRKSEASGQSKKGQRVANTHGTLRNAGTAPFAKLYPRVALHDMKTTQENSCALCMGYGTGGKACAH